nr:EAL domain-containing protein [Staphylococcus epidermidis]
MAMYRLRDGEPRGLHFNPKQQIQTPDRNRIELDLREALRLGQFELHYQPQYSTRGDISSLEVFAALAPPQPRLVPPSIFLSIAEETDIIVPLGHWTVQAACEQLAKWEADPLLCNHPICVNISTKQLQQPDFSEQVEGIITHTGINPAFLWLEMSTRSLSPQWCSFSLTDASQRLGRTPSIDDFGGSCSTGNTAPVASAANQIGPFFSTTPWTHNSSEAAIQVGYHGSPATDSRSGSWRGNTGAACFAC